jgi:hypothetical protein
LNIYALNWGPYGQGLVAAYTLAMANSPWVITQDASYNEGPTFRPVTVEIDAQNATAQITVDFDGKKQFVIEPGTFWRDYTNDAGVVTILGGSLDLIPVNFYSFDNGATANSTLPAANPVTANYYQRFQSTVAASFYALGIVYNTVAGAWEWNTTTGNTPPANTAIDIRTGIQVLQADPKRLHLIFGSSMIIPGFNGGVAVPANNYGAKMYYSFSGVFTPAQVAAGQVASLQAGGYFFDAPVSQSGLWVGFDSLPLTTVPANNTSASIGNFFVETYSSS